MWNQEMKYFDNSLLGTLNMKCCWRILHCSNLVCSHHLCLLLQDQRRPKCNSQSGLTYILGYPLAHLGNSWGNTATLSGHLSVQVIQNTGWNIVSAVKIHWGRSSLAVVEWIIRWGEADVCCLSWRDWSTPAFEGALGEPMMGGSQAQHLHLQIMEGSFSGQYWVP